MPLDKPENIKDGPEPPEPQPEPSMSSSEPTIEVQWSDEPVPLSNAVSVHEDIVMNDMATEKGVEQTVNEETERIDELEGDVAELNRLLRKVTYQLAITGRSSVCPECKNYSLEHKGGFMSDDRFECEECNHVRKMEA